MFVWNKGSKKKAWAETVAAIFNHHHDLSYSCNTKTQYLVLRVGASRRLYSPPTFTIIVQISNSTAANDRGQFVIWNDQLGTNNS